jgi:hypothetical protein
MAQRSRSTFKKRQKEMARQQRRQDKLARRLQRSKERQEAAEARAGGEDPDLAGIVPGPQPPPGDEDR